MLFGLFVMQFKSELSLSLKTILFAFSELLAYNCLYFDRAFLMHYLMKWYVDKKNFYGFFNFLGENLHVEKFCE